jgi:radical SAM superfamily enzyme YgiQ (UPF0313 family)
MKPFRTETDSMGEMQVPADSLYGAQTARGLENFPISDLRFPREFIWALGLIKKHAAGANAALGLLPEAMSQAIQQAESVWPKVLEDARHGRLKHRYEGGLADIKDLAPARHDLLPARYAFGAIQTTRGCPLNCNFCSVTTFNGAQYRQRPVPEVVREFRSIREKRILVVDDNLIGTRSEHIARAKDLFRALVQAKLRKEWVAQATINFADDEELLALAARAGCRGVFIGFESPTTEGLRELGKKINLVKGRDFRSSVRRIQRHNILVVGSFIIGLDVDGPGIGQEIATLASYNRLDNLNTLFLTPLPGTRLWDQMKSEERIALDAFPGDWKYYTLTFPVARYRRLSLDGVIEEMLSCNRSFYSLPRILRRVWSSLWQRRQPLISLVGNLSYRSNIRVDCEAYANFKRQQRNSFRSQPNATTPTPEQI